MNLNELRKKSNDEIQELAIKIKNGDYTERDRNKLAILLDPKLKFFIWKFFNDEEETSHVLMEAHIRIFSKINSFDPKYRFTTWAFTIAKHLALYHIDQIKKKRKPIISVDDVSPLVFGIDMFQDPVEKENLKSRLYDAMMMEIENLPESIEKTLIIEKDIKGLKGEDIALKYQMNLNTVKTKLRKTRRIIRTEVLEKNPDIKERILELV